MAELKSKKGRDRDNNFDNKKDTGSSRRSRPGTGFKSFDKSAPKRPYQEPLQIMATRHILNTSPKSVFMQIKNMDLLSQARPLRKESLEMD